MLAVLICRHLERRTDVVAALEALILAVACA